MADMSIDTLIFELMALAPELKGAEALEDIIYNKLQDTAEAEKGIINAEIKRLRSAAKERHTLQDDDTATSAVTTVMRETNKLALKLVALANAYKGPNADEMKCMVRQLPRAVKTARAPAEAIIQRLQAGVAALTATDADTPIASVEIKEDEKLERPRPSPHAEKHTPQVQPPASAGRVDLPTKPLSSRHTEAETAKSASVASGDNNERDNDEIRPLAAKKRKASPSPLAIHGGTDLQSRKALKTDGSPAHYSVSIPEFTLQRQPTLRVRRDSRHSPLRDRSRSGSRDSRPRAKKHTYRNLICGSCNRHHRQCDGMPQCNECSHKLCVYHPCQFGDTCVLTNCTRIHPAQWESAEEGEDYNVQGLNVHTEAPKTSSRGRMEHRRRRNSSPRGY